MEQTLTPPILAFCGPIGSGKDEAATVAGEFGYDKIGFADHLKEVCKFITGHDYTLRETKDSEVFPGVTGRRVLEVIGTEAMRTLNPNFWIDKVLEKKDIAICDVRFPNEVEAIQKAGGIVIKIIREGCQRTGHESDNWEELKSDFCIINDGTLEEFKQEVRNFIGFINSNYE